MCCKGQCVAISRAVLVKPGVAAVRSESCEP